MEVSSYLHNPAALTSRICQYALIRTWYGLQKLFGCF